ncbi:MAG: hypothetical protein QOE36_3792 [Gaiellaceae bacterium]|jgi:hypothetical protein|nr:hypothetical protein [Gaiellaceae bacterium]
MTPDADALRDHASELAEAAGARIDPALAAAVASGIADLLLVEASRDPRLAAALAQIYPARALAS